MESKNSLHFTYLNKVDEKEKHYFSNPAYQSKLSLSVTSECDSLQGSKSCLLTPTKKTKSQDNKKEFYQLVYLNKLNESYGTIDYKDISSIACDKRDKTYYEDDCKVLSSLNKEGNNKRHKDCIYTYGNVITLALSLMCLYSAFMSLKSLQSSMHHVFGGIGIISLSCIYGTSLVSCLFSPIVINKFGHKFVITSSMLLFSIYIACNSLPEEHLFLIIPASIILGLSKGLLWISTSAFITKQAIDYSRKINTDSREVLCKLNGIFYSIYSTAQIWAHVISSVVLTLCANSNTNNNDHAFNTGYPVTQSLVNGTDIAVELLIIQQPIHNKPETAQQNVKCGGYYILAEKLQPIFANEIISNHSSTNHDQLITPLRPIPYRTWIILCSIYAFMVFLSVIITFTFLKEFKINKKENNNKAKTIKNATSEKHSIEEIQNPNEMTKRKVKKTQVGIVKTLSLFKDPRIQLLVPLIMFTAIKEAFVFSDYTKHYVTCAIGLHGIGLTMICYGVLSTISSLFIGLVVKHIRSYVILAAGALFETGNLMVLMWWKPHIGDIEVFYVIAASMGLCDAIWKTQMNVLLGLLFQDTPEEAFALHRMVFYAGLSLAFGCSQYLLIKTKIYLMGALLLIGLGLYAVLQMKCIPKVKNTNARVALRLLPIV